LVPFTHEISGLGSREVGKTIFSAIFVLGGIMHFVNPQFYLDMMPPWIPFHRAAVVVSGVAEVLLGIALRIPKTSSLAAWGLIILLIAVFPANIQMLVNNSDAAAGVRLALWLRLPLQGVLIFWAYRYTKVGRG
jgi:uncharacterized membrane protein